MAQKHILSLSRSNLYDADPHNVICAVNHGKRLCQRNVFLGSLALKKFNVKRAQCQKNKELKVSALLSLLLLLAFVKLSAREK